MKKILYLALAAAAFTSCSQDESIEMVEKTPIAFNNVFVDNTTRAADLTNATLEDFGVYGSVEANETKGLIFNNTKVYKSGTAFKYDNIQYWIANAQYYFTAIAPYSNAKWSYTLTDAADAQTGTISFNNETAGANQDLLFAYTKPNKTAESITEQPSAVGFTFSHLLSRVRFVFENGFASTSNITLKVTEVKITNAHKQGTIAVTGGVVTDKWTVTDNTLTVDFKNALESGEGADHIFASNEKVPTEHFYLIPNGTETAYNVTFKVALYQAGVLIDTYDRTATANIALNKGISYNINAKLTHENVSDTQLFPIEFVVNPMNDWQDFTDENATVNK